MRLTVLLRLTQLKLMLGRCQLPICFYSTFHLRPMRCNSEGRSNNRWRNSVKGTLQVSRSLRRSSSLTLSRKPLTGKIQRRIVAELRKWAFIILFCSSFWTSVCHCQQPIIAKINCQCGEVLFFLLPWIAENITALKIWTASVEVADSLQCKHLICSVSSSRNLLRSAQKFNLLFVSSYQQLHANVPV